MASGTFLVEEEPAALSVLLDVTVVGKAGSCEAQGLRSRFRLWCESHRLVSTAYRGLRLPGVTLGGPGTWLLAGRWVSSTRLVPGLQSRVS